MAIGQFFGKRGCFENWIWVEVSWDEVSWSVYFQTVVQFVQVFSS